jgi:hypothetical protein
MAIYLLKKFNTKKLPFENKNDYNFTAVFLLNQL